nr:DNA polymerase [Cryobacterium breve]
MNRPRSTATPRRSSAVDARSPNSTVPTACSGRTRSGAALNAPIQGSAADIMKIAMNNIAEDMLEEGLESRMMLQVHDELIFEVAPGEWDALRTVVTHRMETAAALLVPLDVQVGRGANWDAAAH